MIQYVDTAAEEYRAGVCNIGPEEIRRRRQIGFIALIGAVGLAAILLAVDAPTWMRLAVALPVAGAIEGFLQAHLRFCAGYGMAGMQNMGAIGDEVTVEDAQARAADRRKALQIHATAIIGGLAAGIGFALLPI
jgi:hypothetical protein